MFLLCSIPYSYHSIIRIDWRNLATTLLVFLQAGIANKYHRKGGQKPNTICHHSSSVFKLQQLVPWLLIDSPCRLEMVLLLLQWSFYICMYAPTVELQSKIYGLIMESQSSIFPSILPSTETQQHGLASAYDTPSSD